MLEETSFFQYLAGSLCVRVFMGFLMTPSVTERRKRALAVAVDSGGLFDCSYGVRRIEGECSLNIPASLFSLGL